jgi:hypothetical protein
MKKLPALLFATILTASAPAWLHAAEPASAFGLTPAKPDSLLPEGQGGLPLIPENMPALDQSAFKEKTEKKSSTSAAEDALRDRIKFRTAKTKAQSDPELQAIWDSTFKARTDYEQREIYVKYYTLLCERIGKIDKTIKKEELESLKGRYLSNYDQTRIAPTEPPKPAPAKKR